MASVYERLKAAIQASADISADLLETVLLGTPGTQVEFPSSDPDDEGIASATDVGQLWGGSLVPPLLRHLGLEMDAALPTWAYIETNKTGVAPDLKAGRNVNAVSKSEVTDYIQADFAPAFSTTYYAVTGSIEGMLAPTVVHIFGMGPAYVRLQFYDLTGALLDINTKYVMILAMGQAA